MRRRACIEIQSVALLVYIGNIPVEAFWSVEHAEQFHLDRHLFDLSIQFNFLKHETNIRWK